MTIGMSELPWSRLSAAIACLFVCHLAPAQSIASLGALTGGNESRAMGVSADGTTVTGYSVGGGWRAFRWTASSGMSDLGVIGSNAYSYGTAVSGDGGAVVGWTGTSGVNEAFRWTSSGGMQGLGVFAGVRPVT